METANDQVCPLDHNHRVQRTTWMARNAAQGAVPYDGGTCAYLFHCQTCGPYVLSYYDAWLLLQEQGQVDERTRRLWEYIWQSRPKLKALLAEHHTQKLPVPWLQLRKTQYGPICANCDCVQVHIDEFLGRWPNSVQERLDRILVGMGHRATTPGAPCYLAVYGGNRDSRLASLMSESDVDANYFLRALIDCGLVVDQPDDDQVIATPAGWERIEALKHAAPSRDRPAFVAMWYGGHDGEAEPLAFMETLYREHIAIAVSRAGYRCDRADLVPHNDFIMDVVLGMIRLAPFVVADFTGNRGGVYFEAGFARGLGTPVIHTCRKSHFDVAHFDIKQVSTIVWDEPDELQEKLYHRILGTLGPGPFAETARSTPRGE